MSELCDAVRLLREHEFAVDRNQEISRGAEGRVLGGTITAEPAHRQCAVKEPHFFSDPSTYGLDAEGVERVAQVLRKQLNGWAAMKPHPNVLPLLGVFVGDVVLRIPRAATVPNIPLRIFSPLYAMTVERWLTTDGRQLSDDVLAQKIASIVRQVVAGLAHMHSFGLVHRDLKCSNLFCNADASVIVVGDLGLIAHDARTSIHGSVQGNPIHMAPEMLRMGQQEGSKFSVKADVWSLGMLLLEILHLAKDDGLEGYVFNNFAQKVILDVEHNADSVDTPPKQAEMQRVINEVLHQEKYSPSICSIFGMSARQQSGEASSLLEVALQLDRRHRASMEHCAVLTDLHQLRRDIAYLKHQLQECQRERDRAQGIAAEHASEIDRLRRVAATRNRERKHIAAQLASLQSEGFTSRFTASTANGRVNDGSRTSFAASSMQLHPHPSEFQHQREDQRNRVSLPRRSVTLTSHQRSPQPRPRADPAYSMNVVDPELSEQRTHSLRQNVASSVAPIDSDLHRASADPDGTAEGSRTVQTYSLSTAVRGGREAPNSDTARSRQASSPAFAMRGRSGNSAAGPAGMADGSRTMQAHSLSTAVRKFWEAQNSDTVRSRQASSPAFAMRGREVSGNSAAGPAGTPDGSRTVQAYSLSTAVERHAFAMRGRQVSGNSAASRARTPDGSRTTVRLDAFEKFLPA